MKLIRNIAEITEQCCHGALTIGNFDGVHQGHVRIIEHLRKAASLVGGPAAVLTFDPHPVSILRPETAPVPLTWIERKAELLAELQVDVAVAYPTNRQLLELEHESFFDQIIRGQFAARAIIEGPNFCFGRNRRGTIEQLRGLCDRHAIQLTIVEPLVENGAYISSSRIRELIREGQVEQAARMLTHPYRVRGMVRHGHARGAELGFPTANLEAIDTLIPGDGVYAGRAHLGPRTLGAAIHIGPNPTFGERTPKVEIHLLNFEGSLYGQLLEVDFVRRLRDIRQFASAEALCAQIELDVAQTRRVTQES